MIARGLRLTGIRREVLAALSSGQGISADELRRRVALGRGLTPESPRWLSFSTSLTRALRLLEGAGALVLQREETHFGKPCVSWVALTEQGARERTRADGPTGTDPTFAWESPRLPEHFTRWLEQAGERELGLVRDLAAAELARRGHGADPG